MSKTEARPIPITLLILAGGAGRRMGGQDKGLVKWQGTPLIEQVLAPFSNQVAEILISCNRNQPIYQRYGDIVSDDHADYQGPLAGILSGLRRAIHEWILLLPCDCPSPPDNLLTKLWATHQATGARIVCANDGCREQYLFALLHRQCCESLSDFFERGGRSVKVWYALEGYDTADFSDKAENFLNINSAEKLTSSLPNTQ